MIYAHIVSEVQEVDEKTVLNVQVQWFSGDQSVVDKWQKKFNKFKETAFDDDMPLIHNLFRFFAQNNFIPAGISQDKERVFYLPK